ncbi:hypothetical protein H4CHR_04386 [Variovorax sp. PBS-H4]|uniref:hypothetical protein n=1 Tax=Variovorax sp. PBS-H4 TaxID=434008 RepID=UPI001316EBDA|nr:hypothetical protein [Variovorax sp. PBS-H4]VTU38290.1 hypothetical protein H4CHR_04386 [Variovorax sp. PBS-H4]
MRKTLALVALAALAGCASPTGIVPIGDGIYMSSKLGGMTTYSGGQVKAELFKEADAFCAKSGKKLSPVTSTSQDVIVYNYASAEIQFRCV